ncbi:hypothetical protein V5O48_005075 [Marasmius crinis-equi]|uniref:ER-bound oxygenase mpaB/mpaB'/Rubber oxygenase catalytic domain-containing protein n=1 Tax=Marasmius crinis-equi TaxID=585013 RepID=A0ABR3FN94_9AGAR
MVSSGVSSLIPFGLISYLILVRLCRYRRVNKTTAKYSTHLPLEITPQEAQQIVHDSFLYDAPMTMLLGTQITLFKVFGIASIASILFKSGHLTKESEMNKRLADTSTLIATFVSNPYPPRAGTDDASDPRAAIALARVNWIHAKYPIKNDDYLYNLALFMLEPIRWTSRFNWRPLTELERKAIFILWTGIGRDLGIEVIWESYEDMEAWADTYEQEHMLPSEDAYNISRVVIDHFMKRVPRLPGLRSLAYNTILALLDERTRYAMQLPTPSALVAHTIYTLFYARAWIVRHLCLPRRKPALWVQIDSPTGSSPSSDGVPRMQAVFQRRSGPYYYPEKTGFGLILQNLLLKLGLKNPNKVPGKRWQSEGYRLEELGPARWVNEGHQEVLHAAEQIQGCSIRGPWSLAARRPEAPS